MTSEKPRPPSPALIFEIAGSVHPAFAFLAGAQLDLFTPLAEGPLTTAQLANALDVSAKKLKPLLHALVASKLLTVENDRFANTEVANHYLVRNSPRYMGRMHKVLANMWEAELQTAASIRSGTPQAKHDYETAPRDELAQILQGLHPGTIAAAYALLKRYDFSPYHSLVDVGGGSGGLAITLAEKLPQLKASIIDLPSVTPITQEFVNRSEARDRIQVVSRDVVREPIEEFYDVAVLRAFIHVLGPEEVRQALKHVSEAMNPGGHIYILGSVLDDSRLSPIEMVAFNLLFLNIYDDGEAYTEQEHRDWLSEAGFEKVERVLFPDGNSLIRAKRRE